MQDNDTTPKLPFKLSLVRPLGKSRETLTCISLLREIPGNRRVYEALWNERSVIAKLFFHKISAKRHLRREWRGLNILQARGLKAPRPLFTGQTETGQWTIVTEKIADATTVLETFSQAKDQSQRTDLLAAVCRELAKEHNNGVTQKDLHLGNFLLSGGKVYVLDAGQMKFSARQLGRSKSISQLAILSCCLGDGDTESLDKLCREYAQARGWHFNKSDQKLFRRELVIQKRRIIARSLKKTLRTGKRHLKIKTDEHIAVFDRDFCRQGEPEDFIRQIDELMDKGEVLKKGNTCYVSRLVWNGTDTVVKRYNHKGLTHSVRHTIKRSRARRGWLNAHMLEMLNISVPRPLAFIEQRKTNLVWKSYCVTEYKEGQNLHDFLQDTNISEQARAQAAEQVAAMLNKLGEHHISHGDLKHSNLLITKTGPVLTDFDSMKAHRFHLPYKIMRIKDLARIRRNWSGLAKQKISI